MEMGLALRRLSFLDWGPIEFSVARGEFVGISGESGSGKTLLLRAIADLIEHGGELRWDKRTSESMAGHEWRRKIGLMPANPVWWYDRVGDHFTGGGSQWLSALGLAEDIADWDVARLSSGETQRLAFVRLLDQRPECLLLDEPTANLDVNSERRVEDAIRDYVRGENASCLLISHQRDLLDRLCDRQFVMSGRTLKQLSAPNS